MSLQGHHSTQSLFVNGLVFFHPKKILHNSFLSPIYIGYSSESVGKGLWDKKSFPPFPPSLNKGRKLGFLGSCCLTSLEIKIGPILKLEWEGLINIRLVKIELIG